MCLCLRTQVLHVATHVLKTSDAGPSVFSPLASPQGSPKALFQIYSLHYSDRRLFNRLFSTAPHPKKNRSIVSFTDDIRASLGERARRHYHVSLCYNPEGGLPAHIWM